MPQDIECSLDQRLASVHVLVVDDSRKIRQVLTETLESRGATVTAAGTAEVALDLLQQLRPDVLLLSDLERPDKDGYWLVGQVRALAPARGGRDAVAATTGAGERTRRLAVASPWRSGRPWRMAQLRAAAFGSAL